MFTIISKRMVCIQISPYFMAMPYMDHIKTFLLLGIREIRNKLFFFFGHLHKRHFILAGAASPSQAEPAQE